MKKLITAVLLIATLSTVTGVSAQRTIIGSDEISTREVSVRSFDAIATSSGINVFVKQGPAESIIIKSNVADYVDVYVKNGTLHIKYEPTKSLQKAWTEVYVTAPEIVALTASSSADIVIEGVLKGESLKVKASSAADIKGIVEYRNLDISASSSADVKLKGHAQTCTASASSSGDVYIQDLKCEHVTASASSSGDVKVYATETLNASASSSGDVYYRGNPRLERSSTSSSGSIRRIK